MAEWRAKLVAGLGPIDPNVKYILDWPSLNRLKMEIQRLDLYIGSDCCLHVPTLRIGQVCVG